MNFKPYSRMNITGLYDAEMERTVKFVINGDELDVPVFNLRMSPALRTLLTNTTRGVDHGNYAGPVAIIIRNKQPTIHECIVVIAAQENSASPVELFETTVGELPFINEAYHLDFVTDADIRIFGIPPLTLWGQGGRRTRKQSKQARKQSKRTTRSFRNRK
jgi:hypothetical protein